MFPFHNILPSFSLRDDQIVQFSANDARSQMISQPQMIAKSGPQMILTQISESVKKRNGVESSGRIVRYIF